MVRKTGLLVRCLLTLFLTDGSIGLLVHFWVKFKVFRLVFKAPK